jgi:hypothetical protein
MKSALKITQACSALILMQFIKKLRYRGLFCSGIRRRLPAKDKGYCNYCRALAIIFEGARN